MDGVTLADLNRSLELGTEFLLQSQLPEGNFRYEYDYRSRRASLDDNSVRQAGTLWALALMHREAPADRLAHAIMQGLQYFASKSHEMKDGRRFVRYPGENIGKLGTLAILALVHVDVLRQWNAAMGDGARRAEVERHLAGYLKQIQGAEDSKTHLFRGKYRLKDGKPKSKDSPYYNGESLLALVRAAKYLDGMPGTEGLWERIPKMALAGANTVRRKRKSEDNGWLRGYYQWSALAWHELLQTGRPEFRQYGSHMLAYADYMMTKHDQGMKNLAGKWNKGVVLEGVFPALLAAWVRDDSRHVERYACFALRSLLGMVKLQVGHPLFAHAAGAAGEGRQLEPEALGGFQSTAKSPKLRIDTTQHSMHAILEARRLLQGQAVL